MPKLKEVERNEYLDLFDAEVRPRLGQMMDDPRTIGMVCFENLQLDSSSCGDRTSLPVGPDWTTLKTIEQVTEAEGMGPRLGDVPSRFQYPQYLWRKPEEVRGGA